MTPPLHGSGALGSWAGRELYVNGDFDLSLRPRRVERAGIGSGRQVRELPLHLMFAGGPAISVLADARPSDEFVGELERLGFEPARVTIRPAVRSDARLVPFGWNDDAARLNQRYDLPAPYPPLDVVRRVNGRRFAAGIEVELDDGDLVVGSFRSIDRLESFLATAPAPPLGWVVKAEHGNAALGNRRLHTGRIDDVDRRFLSALLAEDDGVMLEPWLDRCGDLSASFLVGQDGGVDELEVHEVINTSQGSFIGARFGGDWVRESWREAMARSSGLVARNLAAVGYHGPVCLDGMLWRDRGTTRIRPLVDLNARRHVSMAALHLWRGWGRDRVVFWRLFGRRKLSLPDSHRKLVRALGGDAFDPARRAGAVVTSPLWIDDGDARRRPQRLGVLFVGASRDDTLRLEESFRERFE